MYLLYADESGDLTDASVDVFVVAGIAAHEDAIRPLAGEINKTMNSFIGRQKAMAVELHGSPLRVGAGEWRAIPREKRSALYHALLEKLSDWCHADTGSGIEPFVAVIDRDHSQSPTETAFGEVVYLFDQFLREGRRRGNPHNGVLVADQSRYERTLQAWVELARARYSRPKQDPRRLYALAETPFFIDSRQTRLLQMGDLLAHAIYRAYNANDWQWANSALPSLTGSDPFRLAHFTSNPACGCPACLREKGEPASGGKPAPELR
jgi:hypothetical protein